MFVHAAAGGGSDAMARTIGSIMEGNMGVPVVVDNKTGGTGSVCWQTLIKSKPNGYTISTVASELTYIGALGYAAIGPDDVDFLGLCQSWSGSLVVPADSEWETFEDFVNYCKDHPGEVSVGDGGTGNIWQIAAYIMERETGIEVNHVPFDGASGEMTALLGGHCDAIVVGASEAKANIDSGAMKCLAVFNDKASSAIPDAPTAPDCGYPNLICNVWVGIGCPKGVPDDVREYLVAQVKAAVESDTFKKYTEERGTDWNYMGPDEFYEMAKKDSEEYSALIEELGLAN
jgi:tripartite-type tricarboxylate transporter receptor subunit TctC